MGMNIMLIIDIVVLALGAYLVFSGIRYYKKGDVDNMLITAEERARVSEIVKISHAKVSNFWRILRCFWYSGRIKRFTEGCISKGCQCCILTCLCSCLDYFLLCNSQG